MICLQVTITCRIKIKEATTVSWYKGDTKLTKESEDAFGNNVIISSYVMESMASTDAGDYQCAYTSKLDGQEKKSKVINLKFFGKRQEAIITLSFSSGCQALSVFPKYKSNYPMFQISTSRPSPRTT